MRQNEVPAVRSDMVNGLDSEHLDMGLRILNDGLLGVNVFWNDHIIAFRQTLISSIGETSDALLAADMPLKWRIELECQLGRLMQYVELADRYIARHNLRLARSTHGSGWSR